MSVNTALFAPPTREEKLAGIDHLIQFFQNEGNWVQGTLARGSKRCPQQVLHESRLWSLEEDLLFAAQQVSGLAYDSIPDFNDSELTTHDLLLHALFQARSNIHTGVRPSFPAPNTTTPPEPVGLFGRVGGFMMIVGEFFWMVGSAPRLLFERVVQGFHLEGPFSKNY